MERIIARPSTLDIGSGKACPDCFYKAMNTNPKGVRYSRETCRHLAKDNGIDISTRCEKHQKAREARQKFPFSEVIAELEGRGLIPAGMISKEVPVLAVNDIEVTEQQTQEDN